MRGGRAARRNPGLRFAPSGLRRARVERVLRSKKADYFQPAFLLQASFSFLWVFSHSVIDFVSELDIWLFMQVHRRSRPLGSGLRPCCRRRIY